MMMSVMALLRIIGELTAHLGEVSGDATCLPGSHRLPGPATDTVR